MKGAKVLSPEMMRWFEAAYSGEGGDGGVARLCKNPYARPDAEGSASLAMLPPTAGVLAGADILRDEGLAYFEALRAAAALEGAGHRAADVHVTWKEWTSATHGFMSDPTAVDAREAKDYIIERLSWAFYKPHGAGDVRGPFAKASGLWETELPAQTEEGPNTTGTGQQQLSKTLELGLPWFGGNAVLSDARNRALDKSLRVVAALTGFVGAWEWLFSSRLLLLARWQQQHHSSYCPTPALVLAGLAGLLGAMSVARKPPCAARPVAAVCMALPVCWPLFLYSSSLGAFPSFLVWLLLLWLFPKARRALDAASRRPNHAHDSKAFIYN
jgi:hypothetical protein